MAQTVLLIGHSQRQFAKCAVADCGNDRDCYGPRSTIFYCDKHQYRFKKYGDPMKGKTFAGAGIKFIDDVAINYSEDGCLTWPFAKNSAGYGHVVIDGSHRLVSRVVCEKVNGPPPTAEHVTAHLCGKGHEACCAPAHLVWATPKENSGHSAAHGTRISGGRCASAKLRQDDVDFIVSMRGKLKQKQLAEMFGITQSNVSYIQLRKTWK